MIESWVEIVADSTPLLQWKSGCIFRSAVSDIVAKFGLLKGLFDRNYALVEFRRSVDVRSLLLPVSNLSKYLQDLAVLDTKKDSIWVIWDLDCGNLILGYQLHHFYGYLGYLR